MLCGTYTIRRGRISYDITRWTIRSSRLAGLLKVKKSRGTPGEKTFLLSMSTNERTTPSISLQADEREWLEEKAEEAGVSLGRYVRQVALCQRPQAEVPFSKTDQPVKVSGPITNEELKKVLNSDLPKIGNNINQLARHVNEQRSIGPKQTAELEQCRKDLDELTEVIIDAIS